MNVNSSSLTNGYSHGYSVLPGIQSLSETTSPTRYFNASQSASVRSSPVRSSSPGGRMYYNTGRSAQSASAAYANGYERESSGRNFGAQLQQMRQQSGFGSGYIPNGTGYGANEFGGHIGRDPMAKRPQLTRQHRSLDNSEFLNFDTLDTAGNPYGQQQQQQHLQSDYLRSNVANLSSMRPDGRQRRNFSAQPGQLMSSLSTSNIYSLEPEYSVGKGYGQQPLDYSSQSGTLPYNSNANYPGSNPYQSVNQPLSVSTSISAMGQLSGPYSGLSQTPQQPYYVPNLALDSRDHYNLSLPVLQREYETLRREFDSVIQKLNSTMNSIKTFWSPELKRERTVRKEESSKLALLNEQLRLSSQENQKQAALIRQLQNELQCQFELHRTIREAEIHSVPKDEYDALRMERDRYYRELTLMRDTMKEFEVQIETQRQTLLSRDDSIKKLLDMLQSKGILPYNSAQDRMELEDSRTRTIELENRCRHLENIVQMKQQDVHTLQEECLNASDKMNQLQRQYERLRMLPSDDRDGNFQALLETKNAQIDQLEKQIHMCDQEITRLREDLNSQRPREFTDKSISEQEYCEMKLKIEKIELELGHKTTEHQTFQTKLIAAEEQSRDLRKHLEVLKESIGAKDLQITHLQTDIEALRAKLENKNETIEQKTQQITTLMQEKTKLQTELNEANEMLKIKDTKVNTIQRKVDSLEEMLQDKEQQLQITKARAASSPSVVQQQQFQDQLEELLKERDRLMAQFREQRDRAERERLEESEVNKREVGELRRALDSLQKEIADRQVLIESQSEKIGDLTKELQGIRQNRDFLADKYRMGDSNAKEIESLSQDLDLARNECERLLKIVQQLESEKQLGSSKAKELEEQLKDARGKYSSLKRSTDKKLNGTDKTGGKAEGTYSQDDYGGSQRSRGLPMLAGQKEQRIEELEEALRESVSITAEREIHIAQLRQQNVITEQKFNQYKEEMNRLKRQFEEQQSQLSAVKNNQGDKDQLIKSLKHERKKHLEEVLQLKQENLLAAIGEKDAHIALLENANGRSNPNEVERLRSDKNKLMKRLKDENERRIKFLNEPDDNNGSLQIAQGWKNSPGDQVIRKIIFVELQKKKLRLFIDCLIARILDISPDLLNGLPRTQQPHGVDKKELEKFTDKQLTAELKRRQRDLLVLQQYANELLKRLADVEPKAVRPALRFLNAF